jgi:ectoine hydroxylase-related dioxygenase (phytanoyl-CoA dioxygenase family)
MNSTHIEELNKNGFTIIKRAIKNPSKKLHTLKNNQHVHSKIMWRLRSETKKYFSYYWNNNDLACSFDGYSLDDTDFNLNWHIDQNKYYKKENYNLQGVLALTYSASTQLLEGSHKYFESTINRCSKNNPYVWEFANIPNNDYIWKKGLSIVIPKLYAGDLLLFDSRLIHRVEPPKNAKNRTVVYVSMTPKKFIDNNILRLRQKVFANKEETTHWCSKIIKKHYIYDLRRKIYKNVLLKANSLV